MSKLESERYPNLIMWKITFGRQFVSNKRQNGLTDRAQILCGTSHDPGKGLWNIKVGGKILENSWNLIV